MKDAVLVLNPGSTSTKVGLFSQDGEIASETISHLQGEPGDSPDSDEVALRYRAMVPVIEKWAGKHNIVAVVGRGGLVKPGPGGIYPVNTKMIDDLKQEKYGSHASNMGAILAKKIADKKGIGAYIADPVTTDEFIPESRISGVPEIQRKCRAHALNMKACFRKVCGKIGKPLPETNLVVAHLGGGFSIGAMRGGRIIDVNDGLLGMGPFSPERAGAMPIGGIVELAFSGDYSKEKLIKKFSKESGLKAYTGTNDFVEVLERIDAGDRRADDAYRGMVHQIAKEIGAMAAVLKGKIDGTVLTGGLTRSGKLVRDISDFITFLGPVFCFPGENELEALAEAGFRAVSGTESLKTYRD